jgi:hypothetical protein
VISGLAEVSRKARPEARTNRAARNQEYCRASAAGIEQQRAQAEQQQADDHRGLVAVAAHHGAGRQGQEEIAQIEGHLHQARLQVGEEEGLLQVRDQHVVEVVGDAP